MMKLVRVVKFFKNSKYIHNISKSMMKTSIATERLVFFGLVLVLGFHLCNCMWLWCAFFFYDSFETTWIKAGGLECESHWNLWLQSAYQTLTMSCGSLNATNNAEKVFQIIIMVSYMLGMSYCISIIGRIIST